MDGAIIKYRIKISDGPKKGEIVELETDLDELEEDDISGLLIEQGHLQTWCNDCEYSVIERTIIKQDSFEELTALQKDFGYTTGEINPVALFGLFGEAGEVMNEVVLSNYTKLQDVAVAIAALIDGAKKEFRQKNELQPRVTIVEPGTSFDIELADTLYYLNLLALNRGRNLEYYARLSVEKVKAKNLKGQGLTATGALQNPHNCFGRKPHAMDFDTKEEYETRLGRWYAWEAERTPSNL